MVTGALKVAAWITRRGASLAAVAAGLLVVWRLALLPLRPQLLAEFLAAAILIAAAVHVPVAVTRTGRLYFAPPVIFALTFSFSPQITAAASLVACILPLSRASERDDSREMNRYAWLYYATAAYVASTVMVVLNAQSGSILAPLTTAGMLAPLAALVGAALFACVLAAPAQRGAGRRRFAATIGGAADRDQSALPYILIAYCGPAVASLPLLGTAVLPYILIMYAAWLARVVLERDCLAAELLVVGAIDRTANIRLNGPGEVTALLAQEYVRGVRGIASFAHAAVWVRDLRGDMLQLTATAGETTTFKFRTDSDWLPLDGQIAPEGPVLRRVEGAVDPTGSLPAQQSWLLVPMRVENELLGLVALVRVGAPCFCEVDMDRVSAVTLHLTLAIQGVRDHEATSARAARDGLTGLWNHQSMHEQLDTEIARSARYRYSVSILMMDVDHFKGFNDRFGHPEGDGLLRHLAGLLQRVVRASDSVGRYGGEEFIAVLPETHSAAAYFVAERIQARLAESPYVLPDGSEFLATISIGIAEFPADGAAGLELVRSADKALYAAKNSGRNCIRSAGTSTCESALPAIAAHEA